MYLVDTDERLLEHIEGWLKMAEGTHKTTARQRRQRKPGVTQKDLSLDYIRLMVLGDCVDLVRTHVEQSKKKEL